MRGGKMRLKDWDRNLKVRLFGEGMMNITFWMFFPFLTIYFADAFGKSSAGFMLIISQVFAVFANLMGGYCADRFGRKSMMIFSSVGQGLAFLLFAIASSPWLDSPLIGFICFSLISVFGSFYWPASQAMVADVVPEKDRSDVFAVFYTSINIAVVIGPILGSIFYVHYRFQLLLFAAVVCIVLAFMLSKWTRETVPVEASLSKEHAGKKQWYEVLVQQFQDYSVIVRDRAFLLFIIAGVLVGQTFMQLDLLIPVYIKETITGVNLVHIGDFILHLRGEQVFGLLLSENGLLVALLTVVITRWMNRQRERNVFIFSSILYTVAILIFGMTHSVWVMIGSIALFTFAELMTAGIGQTFISKLAPDNMRGQYFAAASLRFTIARTVAPLAITASLWLGYNWIFIILAILSLASAVVYAIMFRLFEEKSMKYPLL
jgi:DHA1 family multidrug resistance protein B-like MFS transporter